MKTRTWSLFALMLALCLVLVACTSNDDSDSASTTGPAPTAVADTDESTPAVEVETPDETPALGTVEQPQPSEPDMPLQVEVDVDVDLSIDPASEGIFAGATAALEALESYRFTTTFLFMGEEAGEIESGSIELSGEIMDAQHKHFVWRNLDDGEYFEIIQLEDAAWVYDDGEWESVPVLVADAMSQAVLVFAPSVVWGGLFGGLDTQSTYVGPETVDGMLAHHYTSTYQQWAGYWQGEVLDATGDVWIAEAGYPIRYNFTATGVDEDGDRGSISWTMELTDVGENIVIEPPM
ncbi:MAG: hypothetical protein V3T03_06315 [Candidatus Bipolaricaulota bacterium]